MKDSFNIIIDEASEGLIVVDPNGVIKCYNRMAKEIFGIIYNQGIGHSAGSIVENDIVIIADTMLGEDDGGLTLEDLKNIGVSSQKLKQGDAFVSIGIMGDKSYNGVIEYTSSRESTLYLENRYSKNKLTASIDFCNRVAVISINDIKYTLNYTKSIGHMVVLCGNTGKVKFYQARGYTSRRDDIKKLLNGTIFASKGDYNYTIDVVGRSIFDVHPKETNINIVDFVEAAKGKSISYTNQIKDINGRSTRCSLVQLKDDNKVIGALLKVQDITELENIIKERDYAIASLNEAENKLKDNDEFRRIIGQSDSIKDVRKLARKASEIDSTVLLLGDSGTGKGLVAECIHKSSRRNNKPFIYVNCASIPKDLIESELFGYEGGAFTGSKKEGKKGLFEVAHEGTIFLDEIGDIPLYMQAKLLHVLQSKRFNRVGGTHYIEVDVKIIAATNKDLDVAVKQGEFRRDLYYRINVFPIFIPPLRLRKEDIYTLIMYLTPKICKRAGCEEKRISAEVIKKMLMYDWPGNVREVENVLERAINVSDEHTIFTKDISIIPSAKDSETYSFGYSLKGAIEIAERKAIENALKIAAGDKIEAMRILNISKSGFYEKLKRYNLQNKIND